MPSYVVWLKSVLFTIALVFFFLIARFCFVCSLTRFPPSPFPPLPPVWTIFHFNEMLSLYRFLYLSFVWQNAQQPFSTSHFPSKLKTREASSEACLNINSSKTVVLGEGIGETAFIVFLWSLVMYKRCWYFRHDFPRQSHEITAGNLPQLDLLKIAQDFLCPRLPVCPHGFTSMTTEIRRPQQDGCSPLNPAFSMSAFLGNFHFPEKPSSWSLAKSLEEVLLVKMQSLNLRALSCP